MNRQFIVLSGEAGAGKDSVAKVLVADHGFEMFSLSSSMKTFAADVFGFTDEQLYGPSHARNAPDPHWARPCKHCEGTGKVRSMRVHQCSNCAGEGKINDNSPRRILQLLGDDWAREMIHIDIWTMSARPKLEALFAGGKRIVINDARFENDRCNLHDWMGAARVDVRTPNKKKKDDAAWRKHRSEMSRPADANVEYIISNEESFPFPGLPGKIQQMMDALYPRA